MHVVNLLHVFLSLSSFMFLYFSIIQIDIQSTIYYNPNYADDTLRVGLSGLEMSLNHDKALQYGGYIDVQWRNSFFSFKSDGIPK